MTTTKDATTTPPRTEQDLAFHAQSLDCIHCGLCLTTCPTYRATGREHASPRGRVYLMRAVAEGTLEPDASYVQALDECLVCRNCETVCPSGVHFGAMMEVARDAQKKRTPPRGWKGVFERYAFRALLPKKAPLNRFLSLLRFYQKSGLQWFVRLGWFAKLLPALARKERLLPVIPPRSKRYPNVTRYEARGARRGVVGFLRGCVMQPLMPDTNAATIEVLRDQGYEVWVPEEQTCCGALHVHFGHVEEGRALARHNAEVFLAEHTDAIVTNAAGCGSALKDWPHHEDHDQVRALANKTRDVTEFLLERGLRPFPKIPPLRVAYDDPCHLIHAQKIQAQPRQLLEAVTGIELVPLRDASLCCGAAGIYNLVQPELSEDILRDKVQAILDAHPDVVVTGNPGCMMQIANGLRAAGSDIPVKHPLELLPRVTS